MTPSNSTHLSSPHSLPYNLHMQDLFNLISKPSTAISFTTMSDPIHLPGTTLEGGGQLIRVATCLASLSSTPIRVTSIRGNRSGGGGLKSQHITSIQWLADACSANYSGLNLKSKEITFTPSQHPRGSIWEQRGGEIIIKQSTPGSVNLVFQAILPYILFACCADGRGCAGGAVRVKIIGGTNVSNSPSYDYVEQVLLPMLSLIGIPTIKAKVHSRSWSQGSKVLGGVTYTVTPLKRYLPAFQLANRGEIKSIRATIVAPRVYEQEIRDELDVMFEKRENKFFGTMKPDINVTFEDSQHEKRFYLLLVATTTNGIKLGRDWLYDHQVRAGKIEAVISSLVRKVSDDLLDEIEHGGCVDEYMRDQLVVFQALAEGRSQVYGGKREGTLLQPSLHARTAHWVAEELIGVRFDEDGACEGIGFGSEVESEVKTGPKLSESLNKLKV